MTSLSLDAKRQRRIGLRVPQKLFATAGLIALADWLFYSQPLGVSVVVFILTAAVSVRLCNPERDGARRNRAAALVLGLAVLPFIEEPGLVSGVSGAIGLAYFTVSTRADRPISGSGRFLGALTLLVSGLLWCVEDLTRLGRIVSRRGLKRLRIGSVTVWTVPFILSAIFLALFASANPLIADWLSRIDLWAILSRLSVTRLLFWLVAMVAIWPFIFVRQSRRTAMGNSMTDHVGPAMLDRGHVFGQPAVFRSLVLFNILFALQTATDVAYLWVGVALPDGLTYAAYAHRGAYVLIVTALLAGGFVVIAMRSGSAAERSPLIRLLVYVWIGQTILLVLSSMLRLDLYVDVYSLTRWRAAAFVWMVVVAVGLTMIIARIAFYRSNSWLISALAFVLAATLYLCGFVDFPRLIATYNVAHCRDMKGNGAALDVAYLISLGPDVIPALDVYYSQASDLDQQQQENASRYHDSRRRLIDAKTKDMNTWRAWSFRWWRLRSYLDHEPS